MSDVIVPFSLVGISVDVGVLAVTVPQIVLPVALVPGTVWVDELSQALLLVLGVVT